MKKNLIVVTLICLFIFNGCTLSKDTNKNVGDEKTIKLSDNNKILDEEQKDSFKEKGQGVPVLMYHSVAYYVSFCSLRRRESCKNT